MSLILDALKKSEQERRRDKGPDLQSIHQPVVVRAPKRSYQMLWGVLLIGVNIAVVAYWWQQRAATPAATAAPLAAPSAKPTQDPSTASPLASSGNLQPAASGQTTPGNETVTPTASTVGGAAASNSVNAEYTRITPANQVAETMPSSSMRIEEVDELPEDVRNNLPAMTFSFHVYSSNPQQRTIIINNRRMREGEEVNAGLLLQQITEDGVVLLYAQHRIHISVLSGW